MQGLNNALRAGLFHVSALPSPLVLPRLPALCAAFPQPVKSGPLSLVPMAARASFQDPELSQLPGLSLLPEGPIQDQDLALWSRNPQCLPQITEFRGCFKACRKRPSAGSAAQRRFPQQMPSGQHLRAMVRVHGLSSRTYMSMDVTQTRASRPLLTLRCLPYTRIYSMGFLLLVLLVPAHEIGFTAHQWVLPNLLFYLYFYFFIYEF